MEKKEIQVWARLGAFITVDANTFEKDPEGALSQAIKKGKVKPNGDSYVPDNVMEELIDEHSLNMEPEEINFEA